MILSKETPANKSFDIVYINLAKHTSKKQYIERMLNYANCSFIRFNAVDGQEIYARTKTLQEYSNGMPIRPTNRSIRSRINAANAGRAGCHLSHLLVLKTVAMSDSTKPVLILEDDIDLDTLFVAKIEEALANPPDHWDIILLGGMFHTAWWGHPANKHLRAGKYQACLHAYLVNGSKSAHKIAEAIDKKDCPGRPVDLIIETAFRDDPDFKAYCFDPMIAVQRRDLFESSITLPSTTPWYDKVAAKLFPSAFLRPLSRSLADASSGATSSSQAPNLTSIWLGLFLIGLL
ncbi:hypothetical protein NEHOM01_1888 [Nematocida homosporus]|uniref:uncharacterized protein n=1 Tax=Nematocida homosporus TaxID=1912981 RepID=UPI00221ED721|nr:uncharacterized protein NEHOM01_1888 [Nematocida homosporus]KAI5187043.1 hypothetical protein NEHOM01_1888 [Nematocida homosporus]